LIDSENFVLKINRLVDLFASSYTNELFQVMIVLNPYLLLTVYC